MANNQITYTPADAGETFSVMGVKSTEGLSISGKVITVANAALTNSSVTISEGYNLALASDVSEPKTTEAGWTISGTTAIYKTTAISAGYSLEDNQISYIPASGGETVVTVSGVKSVDGLGLSDKTVTVAVSALNQGTVTVSGDYTLALGSGVTAPVTAEGGWTLDGTTATYRGGAVTAGYTLENNQITYTPSKDEKVITVSGVKSIDGLTLDDTTVTVAARALNESPVTINSGYTLVMGSDAPTPTTTPESWNINGDVATYKATSTSAGYTSSNNQISYSAATGGESFTVNGVKSLDGLSLSGKVVTVATAALDGKNVTISDDTYTLKLADGITPPTTTPAGWTLSENVATYKNAQTNAGYSLASNQITYTPASGGDTLVTVTGIKDTSGLAINEDTVTVKNAALNGTGVTISNGYYLALDDEVPKPQTTEAGWTLNGTMATYRYTATTAGYSLENNQINYTPASGGETIALNGIKSLEGLSIRDNVVTVGTAALNETTVTISEGYTLALANDVPKTATTAAGWTYDRGKRTATYSNEATSAGYSLANNQITYTAESGGGIVTVSGVISTEGLSINRNTVTVGYDALDELEVTISEGYTLALADDVEKSTITPAGWTLKDNVATYNGASTSEGYLLADNKISYVEESDDDETFTVTGVKDTDGLTLEGNVVTVAKSALNQSEVTISRGYTLALGSDVAASENKLGWTKLANGNMIYQSGAKTAGYVLADNKISYVEEVLGETSIELSGIDSASTLILNDSGITLTASSFEDNVAVIQSKNNSFNMTAGDYADKEFTGTDKIDKINNAGSKLAIKGGAGGDKINNTGSGVTIEGGADNDNVTVSGGDEGGNTYVYNDGDGKDVLFNFKANDTIQVLGTSQVDANIKNNDVIFKVGKGTITVRDAAESEMAIALVDSEGKAIAENTYTTAGIISGNTIELAESLKKPYTQAANINEVDGSKVKDGANITGNSTGGKIYGGAGNDTLISTEGDFEFTGGAGNDLFIYGGGDDTVTDYSQKGTGGSDKVSIGNSLTATGYDFDGEDLILDYGNDNALTIHNGKGKEITFAGKKSTVKIYSDEGVFDGKKKSLTLATGTEDSFSAAKYSKLITIDGSEVDNELQLTGNKKANYIVATKSNTTLNGDKGKDTLVGGEGEDVFIYENKSGNKTIQNYNYDDGDVISLGDKAEISQVTSKKGGVVLKVGSNTIAIENTEKFNFTQGDDTKTYDNKMLISDKSVMLASDYKEKVFDLNAEGNEIYNHVSAELSKKAIEIIGDEENNSLVGGKGRDILRGGDNDDTLDGGKGNDTLWGGSDDADTFIYRAGDGTDTIMDYNYDDGDLLQILDKKGNEISNPIKKYSFDGDDLVLSIKGGGKVILANLGTSETKTIKYNGTEQSF